jgi:adenine-specific DNA-methyltransferase
MKPRSYDDLSKQELIEQLKARDRKDATRFGLVWEADELERDKALNSDFVALDLDPALSHGDGPWRNLIIEGDNFDSLRALKLGFAGRVKCIYIDPPYNTGNKDFVYNDRFVDKDHAWRHSLWCEFMFRRLELAKDLLAPDGVIFVSIDDNEVFHLGLLMNRVFGESNFVANLVWEKGKKGDAKLVSVTHEYVLTYVADKTGMLAAGQVWRRTKAGIEHVFDVYQQLRLELKSDHEGIRARMMKWYRDLSPTHPAKAHKHYNWSDERGLYFADNFAGPDDGRESRPRYEILHPITGKPCKIPSTGWRWSSDRTQIEMAVNPSRIHFGVDETTIPCRKSYLHEISGEPFTSVFYRDGRAGTLEVERILGKGQFSFPKDATVIEELIALSTGPKDIILDFFAGSGTTAHAVAKLNASDGGNRRFILVSSTEATIEEPNKNICRDVCAERVRRVMAGYGETTGLGGNFAYLRCRRIAESALIDIAHEQVWIALQLLHRESLQPYTEKALHWREDENESEGLGALAYVERLGVGTMAELKSLIRSVPSALIYTWQATALHNRLGQFEHIQIESIPQSLARKFGFKIT